jgi:DeoR/GlpR family transcriptional regulator of sugar metabolism
MEGLQDLFPEERRLEILKRVNGSGRVAVADLSQDFGVSEVTIRADLQALADQSLVVRTHGGAVPTNRLPETSLTLRIQLQIHEKEQIGAAAAAMVADGEAIFLDTSSTALAMTRFLKQRRELTIFTNSLAVSQALLDASGVTVVMPGGTVQRETVSLVGVEGLEFLRQFNIHKGFFGAHGISFPEGLTDVSTTEAEVKRNVIQMCRQVVGIMDATKWGRIGMATFARLEDLDCIITDSKAPAALVEQVSALGINVIRI